MGSVPPVDSMTISAQKTPVEMCTEAIFDMAMLSSLLPKNRPFTRETRCGLITSFVGNQKLPCVHREAEKISAGEESIGLRGWVLKDQSRSEVTAQRLNPTKPIPARPSSRPRYSRRSGWR